MFIPANDRASVTYFLTLPGILFVWHILEGVTPYMHSMESNLSESSFFIPAGHFLGNEGAIEEAAGLVYKSSRDVVRRGGA